MNIEIVFFKPQSIYGKLIRLIKKQNHTHVGINFGNKHSDSMFPHGVRLTDYRSDYDCKIDYEINNEQHEKMIKYMSNRIGMKYDLLDILYFFNPRFKGFSNRYICTEYVIELLNILELEWIDNELLYPDELLYFINY